MFENPRRGRRARNVTTNAPKILDLKSPSEQVFSRKLPLGAPEKGNVIPLTAVASTASAISTCVHFCSVETTRLQILSTKIRAFCSAFWRNSSAMFTLKNPDSSSSFSSVPVSATFICLPDAQNAGMPISLWHRHFIFPDVHFRGSAFFRIWKDINLSYSL